MCLLFPVFLLPLYWDAHIWFIFKALIYVTPAWLLHNADVCRMRITNQGVICRKYAWPFTKVYKLKISDISKVLVFIPTSSNASPTFTVCRKNLRRKLRVEIYSGLGQELYKFFIDRKIPVDTNDEYLRNFRLHYINDPRANMIRRKKRRLASRLRQRS